MWRSEWDRHIYINYINARAARYRAAAAADADRGGAIAPDRRPRNVRCNTGNRDWRPCRRNGRSEEHTSELQSLMRISYAVFCLKKKKNLRCAPHHEHTKLL